MPLKPGGAIAGATVFEENGERFRYEGIIGGEDVFLLLENEATALASDSIHGTFADEAARLAHTIVADDVNQRVWVQLDTGMAWYPDTLGTWKKYTGSTTHENFLNWLLAAGIVRSGAEVAPTGTLALQVSAGNLYGYDAATDNGVITTRPVAAQNPLTFDLYKQDGLVSAAQTTLDVTNYDDGGVITDISGTNNYQHWIVMLSPDGTTWAVLYGQKAYVNKPVIIREWSVEPTVIPAALAGYIEVGRILTREDTPALTSTQNIFLNSTKWGESGNSAGAGIDAGLAAYFDAANPDHAIAQAWAASELKEALGGKFEPVPAGGQLESFKSYFISNGDTPIMPVAPTVGDWVEVENAEPIKGGYTAPYTGDIKLSVGGNVTPNFAHPPSIKFKFVFDGTAWTSVSNLPLRVTLNSVTNSGEVLSQVHSYTVVASSDMELFLPPRAFGTSRIILAPNSTGSLTIKQSPTAIAPSQIKDEQGAAISSFVVTSDNRGQEFIIAGNPEEDDYDITRPWVSVLKTHVVWHGDISDQALAGRINLYPTGSSIRTHTPPTHIENGSYSVAIGDMNGDVIGEIEYISNGIVGAGGAWIEKSVDQDTRILDNIEVGIRSSGTNAGSNISLTFVDKDGVDYPASTWAVSLNLVQYTGGTATIVTDKALYNGTIGVGRNKQGFGKFYYTGENPNGLSAIRVDATTATTAQDVTVTYQGTNYNDSFAALADLNTPLPWTTIIEQEKATDQAAYIVELTEYTEGKIVSFREPDNTDADYGTLFNWQVKTGQTVLDTEVNDTSNEAELIAIKPKLERFGIGTVTPEGLVPDWTPNNVGGYAVGDRVVAPMPVNADFISNDGAIANANYIFEANAARPDTISAFDDTEADSGAWDLVGLLQIDGTDDRVLAGSGLMAFDPLTTLSNSVNEFIHWTTTDNPQDVLFVFNPSFITVWKDYTGNNLVQPAALNDTFTIPANSQMWVHRVGNAIQITFESNEGGASAATLGTVSAAANLDAGIYDLDSTAAGFTVTLTEEIGIWDFSNVKQTAGTNQVLIGTALQTFTDNAGVQQNGPFAVDVDGAAFRIMNVAGGTAFLVVEEVIPVLTGNLLANGGWDASTNTPDLTLAASQGDGTNVYTYLITATGTQDIGDGPLPYEAGGQITFFDQPGVGATFRYDSVAASGLRQNPVADLTALAAVAATDAMHQTVLDDGSGNRAEYVFNLGRTPIGTDVADGGATGAWVKVEVLGTVASDEIGTLKQVPNVDESGAAMANADYVAKGLLPLVNGYTLTDGATNNPKFALMFPTFVSGNNLVVPSNIGGDFVRNLGGNAAAFMVSQTDATAPNSLRLRTASNAGGNAFNATHSMFTNTGNTTTQGTVIPTGDTETRPENFAMQFCLVLDSYSRVLMVDPDLVPVDDARILLASGSDTNVSGTESLTLAGGRTLADLGTEFASIEFSAIDGSWDNAATGTVVDAATLVSSLAVKISGHGSSGTRYFINGDFSSTADTTITVSTDGGSNNYRRFRMYGIKSQKTVISPANVPVDDQAASGYIDIGTTRIQWADEASASGGTVVFPQPFASTPVITATSTQNSGHNMSVLTKSATQFTFDQWDIEDVQQNGTWNWIAIGVKP